MTILFRRRFSRVAALAFLCAVVSISIVPVLAQQDSATKRRLVQQSAPAYPPLARSMALAGIVRVDALVSPEGSVKSVDVKGGHPVLVQAAVNAVRRWRWEPGSRESHENVEVKFSPE